MGVIERGTSQSCLLGKRACLTGVEATKHLRIHKQYLRLPIFSLYFPLPPQNNLSRLSVFPLCAAASVHKSITAEKRVCVTLLSLSYLEKNAWRTAPSEKPVFTLRWFPPVALVCLSTTRGSLTYIGSYISRAKGTRLDPCWRRAKSAAGPEL